MKRFHIKPHLNNRERMNDMKRKLLITTFLLCFMAAMLILSGCNNETNNATDPNQPGVATENITLYFSDDQAMYLVPETRALEIDESQLDTEAVAKAIVEELIAGPQNTELIATMPPDTKLLEIRIATGVATVDFSPQFISNHPGGSTSESMTLNSLANSLTELPEIKQVQILVDGQTVESLAGHVDISEPLTRDESLIKK